MAVATIQVTVCESDGVANTDPSVEALRSALAAADPDMMNVTNEYLFDMYTLHSLVKLKLARTPHVGFDVGTDVPSKVGHAIDEETGKWIDVDTGIAIVYEATNETTAAKFFIGFQAKF